MTANDFAIIVDTLVQQARADGVNGEELVDKL